MVPIVKSVKTGEATALESLRSNGEGLWLGICRAHEGNKLNSRLFHGEVKSGELFILFRDDNPEKQLYAGVKSVTRISFNYDGEDSAIIMFEEITSNLKIIEMAGKDNDKTTEPDERI